jgi:hypothetical protein
MYTYLGGTSFGFAVTLPLACPPLKVSLKIIAIIEGQMLGTGIQAAFSG